VIPFFLGSGAVHVLVTALQGLPHTPDLGVDQRFVIPTLAHSSWVLILAGFLKLTGSGPTLATGGTLAS
jgi:hypothetical protein